MTEDNIFCGSEEYNDENSFQQKRYRAFNKEVGENRYLEIVRLIKNDILKDFKLELSKNSWKDEWKKVTNEQWKRLSEIPEFDIDVVELIIGFKPEIKDVEEMTLKEICKELGRDIKIIKE